MPENFITGDIAYLDRAGGYRGRENFLIKRTAEEITLTADVSIFEDGVERSVVYSVTRDFAPQRCFVAVRDKLRDHGAALFTFEAEGARLVSTIGGDIRDERRTTGALPYFGAHPIVMDGWIPVRALRALGSGYGKLEMSGGYTSSVEHDGASPAGLNAVSVWGQAQGVEPVTTAAGVFECHRIELTFGQEFSKPHPPYTLWITTSTEHILVRAEIPAFGRRYELQRLVESRSAPPWR